MADAILGLAASLRKAAAGSKVMIERLTSEYRMWGLRLVSLLVIVSFAFIPVRCDASTAPHSIFVAPDTLNAASGHAHHSSSAPQHQVAKSVPHHSPTSDGMTGHQHGEASHPASLADDPAGLYCSIFLGSGGDPESQQPVGATLDLPTTSVTPNTATFQPLDTQTQLLRFAPAAELSGITAPPDAPPPKAS